MADSGSGNEKGAGGKGKQASIPGMEGARYPEVTKAAIAYKTKRDARMQLEQEERAERDRLTERMRKRGITRYIFEDEEFEAYIPEVPDPQAKVRTIKTEE